MAVKLEEYEEEVKEKIEREHWTYEELSIYLKTMHPGERGFSIRSIERFCGDKGISKTTKLCNQELDEIVRDAVDKVQLPRTICSELEIPIHCYL